LPLPGRDTGGCSPLRLTIDGETYGIQWDPTMTHRGMPELVADDDLADDRQLVILERRSGALELRFGDGTEPLVLAELLAPLRVSDCGRPKLPPIETSLMPNEIQRGRITGERDLGAGCFALAIESSAAHGVEDEASRASSELALCLPESEFPFVVGDEISFTSSWMSSSRATLGWYAGDVSLGPYARVSDAACGQVRDACGAIWQPLDVTVNGTALAVGQRVRVARHGPMYGETDVYLVRALRPIVTLPICHSGLDLPRESYIEFTELNEL
jgi:hypothetical protein